VSVTTLHFHTHPPVLHGLGVVVGGGGVGWHGSNVVVLGGGWVVGATQGVDAAAPHDAQGNVGAPQPQPNVPPEQLPPTNTQLPSPSHTQWHVPEHGGGCVVLVGGGATPQFVLADEQSELHGVLGIGHGRHGNGARQPLDVSTQPKTGWQNQSQLVQLGGCVVVVDGHGVVLVVVVVVVGPEVVVVVVVPPGHVGWTCGWPDVQSVVVTSHSSLPQYCGSWQAQPWSQLSSSRNHCPASGSQTHVQLPVSQGGSVVVTHTLQPALSSSSSGAFERRTTAQRSSSQVSSLQRIWAAPCSSWACR
jgi:hypothetical protein